MNTFQTPLPSINYLRGKNNEVYQGIKKCEKRLT